MELGSSVSGMLSHLVMHSTWNSSSELLGQSVDFSVWTLVSVSIWTPVGASTNNMH